MSEQATHETLMEEFAIGCKNNGQIIFEETTLRDGSISPYYVDLGTLQSYPRMFDVAIRGLESIYGRQEEESGLSHDLINGIPARGTALGIGLARQVEKGHLQTREKLKTSHGVAQGEWIIGGYREGMNVAEVDEVISTGGAKIEGIEKITKKGDGKEPTGLTVTDVYLLLDRETGGVEEVESHGYRVHSFMTTVSLMGILLAYNQITPGTYQRVLQFTVEAKKSRMEKLQQNQIDRAIY